MDVDELVCSNCGHIGLTNDGGYDLVCPVCGADNSLYTDEDDEIFSSDFKDE